LGFRKEALRDSNRSKKLVHDDHNLYESKT
jgi:hypothetical protein